MTEGEFLGHLHIQLEKHHHFQENKDALEIVMMASVDAMGPQKTAEEMLHDFSMAMHDVYPHPTLPFLTHASRAQMEQFQTRSRDDINNERHYNCVMTTFMDAMRAQMHRDHVPADILARFDAQSHIVLSN